MKRFPDKLTTLEDSLLWSMLTVVKAIPQSGINIQSLLQLTNLSVDDFMEALDYLYIANYIEIEQDIIKRIC